MLVTKMALQGRVGGAVSLRRILVDRERIRSPSRYILLNNFLRESSVRFEAVRCASSGAEAQRKKFKLGIFGKGVLLGIGLGGAYGYYSYEQRKKLLAKPASGAQFLLQEPPPKQEASRRVIKALAGGKNIL